MAEIQTIEGGQKDALLRRADIKKKCRWFSISSSSGLRLGFPMIRMRQVTRLVVYYLQAGRQAGRHHIQECADCFFQLNLLLPYSLRSQGDYFACMLNQKLCSYFKKSSQSQLVRVISDTTRRVPYNRLTFNPNREVHKFC